jgi:general stress protein 26
MIHPSPEENKHLSTLIDGIKVAMLTTIGPDGSLRSRPMATLPGEFDGTLWFFTNIDSPKVDEVQLEEHVNVSYDDSDDHRYLSISGRATLSQERQQLEELWNPILLTWFPLGLDDPQLALLRVEADSWEYWDCQVATMVPRECDKPALLPAEEILAQEKPRTADVTDTWVSQDVGTRKNRNVIPESLVVNEPQPPTT